jgi:superfamily II DNA helicase RecQ
MDIDDSLQQMMGSSAVFHGSQKAIIQSIIQRKSPMIAVMPTGAGKSLLFRLPAWMSHGGTTIVVVPLVALRADLQQRCQALGILCVEWDSRRSINGASIVLVTPESAISESFQTFINRKQ